MKMVFDDSLSNKFIFSHMKEAGRLEGRGWSPRSQILSRLLLCHFLSICSRIVARAPAIKSALQWLDDKRLEKVVSLKYSFIITIREFHFFIMGQILKLHGSPGCEGGWKRGTCTLAFCYTERRPGLQHIQKME